MTKLLVIILLVTVGGYLFKDKIIMTDSHDYSNGISRFIALEGTDEYVIATLKTTETYQQTHCLKELFGQCLLPTRVEVNPEVFYKYFIKLSELRYSLSGDTLILQVPQLYLSTPVAMDSDSIEHRCHATFISFHCKQAFNNLMDTVSGRLIVKGNLQKTSVYEKAAKSLADNINAFLQHQNQKIGYKNIAVHFNDEDGRSEYLFRYNDSYCGAKPCSAEISFGENWHWIIQ